MVPNVTWFFGIALAAMYWPGQAGAAEVSRWAVVALGCPALLFFVKTQLTRAHYVGLVFLAWATVSMLWSEVFDDALNGWLQLVFLSCAFCLGSAVEESCWFYRGLGIGMAVSSVFAVIQFLGFDPVNVAPGNAAPAGLFVNSNVLGWSVAPIFVLVVAQEDWLLVVLLAPTLLLSECRSAIIAACLCVGLYAWKRLRKYRTLVALGACAIGTAVVFKISGSGFEAIASLNQRLAIWQDASLGLTVLGHGIGSFYSMFPLHETATAASQPGVWVQLAHAHNDYLELLFELGIPGLGLFLAVLLLAFKHGATPERLGLLCIAIIAMVGFPLYQPLTGCLAAFLAGHAVNDRDRVRRAQLYSRSLFYRGHE